MGCNTCKKTPCGCLRNPLGGSSLVPQPFYVQAPSCVEDHTQKIYITDYSVGLRFQGAWNIPVCGGVSVISTPDLNDITIGTNIWHPSYGYFEVLSFDPFQKLLTIQNNCLTENAAPGTQVPECTIFTVAPPPCCQDSDQSGVFVAIDFTAPAIGDCIDITVTSQSNLGAGNEVQIGTGIYFLDEIKANNIVTICNTGEGIVPGTPVIAQNAFGQYQYPIGLIQTNACSATPITQGKLIVCDGVQPKPLTGSADNYVPALEVATQTVTFQPVVNLISSVCSSVEYGPQIVDASFVMTGSGTVGTQYSLASLTMPNDGYNYLIEWTISATCLFNYEPTSGTDTAPAVHELHIVPNGIGVGANQYKCGRTNFIVYNISKFGGGVGPVPSPTFPFITGDLIPDTVAFSMMYNTYELSTYFVRPGTGQIENPVIIYRCWRGDNWATGAMNCRFFTAGRATLWRI